MRLSWLPLLFFCAAAQAATIQIHYAPAENLEPIDVALIDDAGVSIDMAAYVLTDESVIEALGDAADRGVAVRLYLDRSEFETHAEKIADLIAKPGVVARVKPSGVLMHMKAYAVDGAQLRTGSGNFSHSGLSRQDNDLLVTDDKAAVQRFERDFDAIFARGLAPQAMF
ncbi:MAG TPA: phospholipase D-like domain-containing protein [Roseiarcus sp.]|nr:phospholipase D-like domain-containing protein [Roseiarcus sp.]